MKDPNQKKIIHYVLTRFNLEPSQLINKGLPFHGLDNSWLFHRFDLFYKFCFPSVINQTCLNFKWIILIHESTPKKWVDQLKKIIASAPIPIIIKIGKENNADHFRRAIHSDLMNEPKFNGILITSRLDNDDCISINFVKQVQHIVKSERKTGYVINFLRGYFHDLNTSSLYLLKKYPTNPYLSLVEDFSNNIKTVASFKHRFVGIQYEIKNVNSKNPMFMTLIHGENLLNHTIGRPVYYRKWDSDFRIMYNDKLNFINFIFNFIIWLPLRIKQFLK